MKPIASRYIEFVRGILSELSRYVFDTVKKLYKQKAKRKKIMKKRKNT